MSERRERLLIGDANHRRVELLCQILTEEFSIEPAVVQHFNEIKKRVVNSSWDVILIAHNLPIAPRMGANFRLCADALPFLTPKKSKLVRISGGDDQLEPSVMSSRWAPLFVPAIVLGKEERRQIIGQFRQWLSWSPRWPEVALDDDPLLHEQARSLTASRKLDAGAALLAQLVRGFFNCDKVAVARLGQGKSGSRVFRICPEPNSAAHSEFVLKIVEKRDEWKLRYEIAGYQKACEILATPFRKHIPELCLTCSPQAPPASDFSDYVASTSGNEWQAICYSFLGGVKLGQFIDLESVLIANSSKLSEKISSVKKRSQRLSFSPKKVYADRLVTLKEILEWLRGRWYERAQSSKDDKQLWETPDATPKLYSELPPYRFTGKFKERTIAFLDSFDAQLGERFPLPCALPDWDKRIALIRDLLSKDSGPTGFSKLDCPSRVLLSPAHGDLNAANVLLWLEQKEHPFLIDFPFYQERGHAVQDFAKLEVEMKFILLDRQADSPADELPAFDYTPTQMALWLELEECLLNDWNQPRREERDWNQQGYKTNVIRCLELIQLIRNTAKDVYREVGAADNFPDEYWAALLFHTLQVLGYSAVSIFKRLFAVYSASSILEKLR